MWGDRVEVAGASGEDALNRSLLGIALQTEGLPVPGLDATAFAPPSRQGHRLRHLHARGSQRVRLSAQHFLITVRVPDLIMSCDVLSVALQRRPIGEPPSLGMSEQAGSLGSHPSLPLNKSAVRSPSGPAREGNEGSKAEA